MKKNMQNKLIAMLVGICLVALTGCYNTIEKKQMNHKIGEPITLTMQLWGSEQRKEVTMEVIELYKKTNPMVDIEIKLEQGTYSQILAKSVADENLADIIQVSNLHNYAKRGLLEPFDSYVKEGVIDLSDIEVSDFSEAVIDGKVYGMPLGLNAYAVAANPIVFEEAGVEMPTGRYTFDELYEIAKMLKKKISRKDFYPLEDFFKFTIFARSKGVRQYNDEGTALGYEDDKIFIEYFETYLKWLEEGLIAPRELVKSKSDEESLIVKGNAALFPQYSSMIGKYSNYAGCTLKVLPTPSGRVGEEGSFIRPAMYFSVSSYSKYKQEAMAFINFFVNDIEANAILNGERGIPISRKVRENLEEKSDDANKQQYYLLNYLKSNPSAIDPPNPVFKDGAEYVLNKYLTNILNGKITPKEAAPLFREEANQILSKGIEE